MEEDERVGLPEAGDTVGDWRIVRFLGEGRSGTVFEVHSTKDERRTGALKIHLGHTRKATKEEFRKEIDFVADQPISGYMPAFHDRGLWRGHPFYVMELAGKLPRHLPPSRLRRLIVHVARALRALHDKGLIHCDVKPDNIGLIDDRVVLLDFGNVREREDARRHPTRVGTWDFMAPEVREQLQLSPLADIFSLGATLGTLAKRGSGSTFDSLVNQSQENNPNLRPKTMDAFIDHLRTCSPLYQQLKIIAKWTALVTIILGVTGWYLNTLGFVFLKRSEQALGENQIPYEIETDFRTAFADNELNDYTNAFKQCSYIVNHQSYYIVQACNMLSEFYRLGLGVDKNEEKHREYSEKAVNLKFILHSHSEGNEIKPDYKRNNQTY